MVNSKQNFKIIFGYLIVNLSLVFITDFIDKACVFSDLYIASTVVLFFLLIFVNRALFPNINIVFFRYLAIAACIGLLTIVVGFVALVLSVNVGLELGWQL